MRRQVDLSNISHSPRNKISKAEAEKSSLVLVQKLTELQDKLFAQGKYSVLIILQGMDTAGKDSAVKHVFSGVNPGGCKVKSFKVPTPEEAAHHFLWRCSKECPEKGMIGIFNRSYYEDVLVPKVNRQLNERQLKQRCEEINAFEKGLVQNRTVLLKFFLHISQKEQLQRLKERKMDPTKRWKYQKSDVADINAHNKFEKAYEFVLKNCSNPVPWHIVPSDKKWYKNYYILNTVVSELKKHDINYPELPID